MVNTMPFLYNHRETIILFYNKYTFSLSHYLHMFISYLSHYLHKFNISLFI